MSGAGTSPAGVSYAGQPYNTWLVTRRADLVSSRYINTLGEFELLNDGTGGAVPMNDTFHRALNLLARAYWASADTIGADFPAATDARIRAALAPLTRGQEPALEITRITALDSGTSITLVEIEGRDLVTGEVRVLKRR